MQVRLATQLSGTRDGEPWPPAGSTIDLPDDEANAMLEAGTAFAPDTEQETILVPPEGIHTPGTTAFAETERVEVPANAAADPEGTREAIRRRDAGKTTKLPSGTGTQFKSGAAMTPDEADKANPTRKTTKH